MSLMPARAFFMPKRRLESPYNKTPEDLNKDFEAFSKQIRKYNTQLEKGRKVVELIDQYNKIFSSFKVKDGTGLEALLKYSEEVKNKIEANQSSASELLQLANQALTEARTRVDEINTIYSQFTPTRDQINDPESGLQALFNKSNEISTQIREFHSSTEQIPNQISSTLENVTKKFEEINSLYNEFSSIREQINNPESGLQALTDLSVSKKNELDAIKGQANKLFLEISRIKDDSTKFIKDIENYKQQAESNINKIKQYEKESEEYKSKIADIWEVATGSGLANSFHERKNELMKGVLIWIAVLILGVLLYIGLLIWIYHETFKSGTPTIDVAAWYRLTITLPVLFLVAFASVQYGRERSLLEKYAFKSATALALEAYTLLLTGKFAKFEKSIVSFVLNVMTMIYKEPHDKEKRYKINFGINRIFNIGLEESQMEEIDDLLEKKVKAMTGDTPKKETIEDKS